MARRPGVGVCVRARACLRAPVQRHSAQLSDAGSLTPWMRRRAARARAQDLLHCGDLTAVLVRWPLLGGVLAVGCGWGGLGAATDRGYGAM